jgi:hypothetical protein
LSLLLIATFAGCHRDDGEQIRYATAPKQQAPIPEAVPDLPAGHPEVDATSPLPGSAPAPDGFAYTMPAGWTLEGAKPMRLATFAAGTAEVVITRFPTGTGDWVSNVNRWRNQVSLPPVDSADPSTGTPVKVDSQPGHLYDFTGPDKKQLVVVVNKAGSDWFLKIIGPRAVVEAQKQPFMDFLGSARLGD